MSKLNNLQKIALILLFFIFIVSCKYEKITIGKLPLPDRTCRITLDWNGLTPGKSSKSDVTRIMGEPFKKGIAQISGVPIQYYSYKFSNGKVSKFAVDRIFFRPNGIIDWLEIIEADRFASITTVFDTTLSLGNELDAVYTNNNYRASESYGDFLAGPDRIYVWSECGLALDALPEDYVYSFLNNKPPCYLTNENDSHLEMCRIQLRYGNPILLGGELIPDMNDVVLMKFYFQSTSYQGFLRYYMEKIPYGIWSDYLNSLKGN